LSRAADVVVIGAGIAGVSAGYELAVRHAIGRVVVIDPRPPLTLTSDKSTECYRNWWPNRPMVGLMSRSIDLLEKMAAESGNVFGLNRRGYLFVTAEEERFQQMVEDAHHTSTLGAGPVRFHPGPIPYRESPPDGFAGAPEGADILVGPEVVLEHFPYITPEAVGAVHVRRAGWFGAQQLGAWMLEQGRSHGLELVVDEVVGIETQTGRVRSVHTKGGQQFETPAVVDAAGPMADQVAALAGVPLPIFSELHLKVACRDHLGVVPRDAPMIIWSDTQTLEWSDDEREALQAEGRQDLLGELPVFCHGRPEGGSDSPYLLGLWEYHGVVSEPVWPVPEDSLYPEVVLRGLSTMVPGLTVYRDRLPQSTVDGGYYTKTRENRPLIGPAGPAGFHLLAGFSGFGVMVAAGAADLLARHVAGAELPDYAGAFLLDRYDDPEYMATLSGPLSSGQL
jgi:glycine/D-amino acid oxidase-like deaminating enzyme